MALEALAFGTFDTGFRVALASLHCSFEEVKYCNKVEDSSGVLLLKAAVAFSVMVCAFFFTDFFAGFGTALSFFEDFRPSLGVLTD